MAFIKDLNSTITAKQTPKPINLSFSAWNRFRACPRSYENRYIKRLIPINQDDERLEFGSNIHKCLEFWYDPTSEISTQDRLKRIYEFIDNKYPHRIEFNEDGSPNLYYDPAQKLDHMKMTAMIDGYINLYPEENFEVIAVEQEFSCNIENPETQACSKRYKITGVIDGIVKDKETGKLFILEHKTASKVDEEYLAKLPMDTQISLYCVFAEQVLNQSISGIIYNVLVKTTMKPAAGETEEEFQIRYQELCKKNKSGKSTATRKIPETDEEFAIRLAQKYSCENSDKFYRQVIYIPEALKNNLKKNLWAFTQSLLSAKRAKFYPQNQASCFDYHRPCDYYDLCLSGDDPVVQETLYFVKKPAKGKVVDNGLDVASDISDTLGSDQEATDNILYLNTKQNNQQNTDKPKPTQQEMLSALLKISRVA